MEKSSRIFAIFDLDGTITRGDTYLFFLLSFLKHRPLRLLNCWFLPVAVICYKLRLKDNSWLKKVFLQAIAGGVEKKEISSFLKVFVKDVLENRLRRGALTAIAFHRNNGHRLVLASASFDFYVKEIGHQLGFDTVLCTRSVWDEKNRLKGEILGLNCYGAAKRDRVVRYLEKTGGADFIIAYSDHHSDLALLEWVDRAVSVNPTPMLRELAGQKGFEVKIW